MKRTHIVVGLVAGLTAGAGAGFALTQGGTAGASTNAVTVSTDDTTGTDDTSGTDATTGTGTDGTGTDETGTDDGTGGDSTGDDSRLRDALAPLVDDGTLTEAQLEAVVETLDDAFPGGGHGGMGHRGHGGMHLDAAATALGLDVDALRTQLADGSTLAEVATAQGIDVQVVIDAIVAESSAHLAEEVTEGDLTQAEADQLLADLTTSVTTLVNEGWTGGAGPMVGGPRMGDGMGGHGHGDMGGDRDGDDDVTTTVDTGA